MINLLPPDIKTQVVYAKYNRLLLGYVKLSLGVIIILGGIFAGTTYYVESQTKHVAQAVKDRQDALVANLAFQKQAQEASDRLKAIKSLVETQTRFSVLLNDLSLYLPQGVALDGITLTGDDKKPLSITVSGSTYDTILAFRNAVLLSPRIAGADLISINNNATGFQGNVLIAFKAGQAK